MLIHEEKQADGQVVVTERQIKGDEMHVVSTPSPLLFLMFSELNW